jgi:hypothetical protein
VSVKIFVSCVSDEFGAYRDRLRTDLTRHNVEVKVQEDFKDYGVPTVVNDDVYIGASDAVIHVVGDMTGAIAQPALTEAILTKYPDITERLPQLRELLELGEDISCTQWEAWLALYHGKPLLIAQVSEDAEQRGPNFAPTAASRAAQRSHLDQLQTVERYPGCTFAQAGAEGSESVPYLHTCSTSRPADNPIPSVLSTRLSALTTSSGEGGKPASFAIGVPAMSSRASLSDSGSPSSRTASRYPAMLSLVLR